MRFLTSSCFALLVLIVAPAMSTLGIAHIAPPLEAAGISAPPFGKVDTPLENAVGIRGAVAFTGWALDDVQMARVGVCRAAVAGESVGADGRCGGQAQIYVGDAVFIEGARPDVQRDFPAYPRNGLAGWGFMVLTNFLPAQGNGVYSFFMWAQDVEGSVTLLGTRTITCDNAHATLPFGTIDTPGQGETISGSSYVNFGWALTQNPKYIPIDFPALMVYVDGAPIGPPSYGYPRSDIATFFPGLANSNAAVGYKIIDTTKLSNGLHTIGWTATDNLGNIEGLGSRFFRVANTTASTRSAASRGAATSAVQSPVPMDALPPPTTAAITGRQGWDANAAWRAYPADASGLVVVHGQELDRFEWLLNTAPGERVSGYVQAAGALQALPVGSNLEAATGHFTWAPGAGFIGGYDLVFLTTRDGQVVRRQDVRVVLRPKSLGPQVIIDTPGIDAMVDQPFTVAGWAADLQSADDSGIDTIHVWAYPVTGAAPVFLGVADGRIGRPDVAAAYGDQFKDAGYQLSVNGLTPGDYDVAVFAWARRQAEFLPASVVRVHVR
jgi:hypothetical protein